MEEIKINLNDIKAILSAKALVLKASGKSENSAQEATEKALQALKLDGLKIKEAQAAFLHFTTSPDCSFSDLVAAMAIITESLAEDAEVIFATDIDENKAKDEVEVLIILSFQQEN